MAPLKWACVAALAALGACGSGGPVTATSCSVHNGPGNSIVLRATLTNNTASNIRHVGVLVSAAGIHGAQGSVIEYEFDEGLKPFERRSDLIGAEYADKLDVFGPDTHFGAMNYCLAHFVSYADGKVWSVSPL